MLVEGRINPPPSTRQSVDLSSAAGVAVLPTSPPPPPAAAAATSSPFIFSHLPSPSHHHHQHTLEARRTEEDVQVADASAAAPFARPTQRRTVQEQQQHQQQQLQQCAQSSALIASNIISSSSSGSSSSSERTARRHCSSWRTQCQVLICKILTLFSLSAATAAAALLPSLSSHSDHSSTTPSSLASSLRQTSTISSNSNQHSKRSLRGRGGSTTATSFTSTTPTTTTSCHRFSTSISIISIITATLLILMLSIMGSVHCSSLDSHHPSKHSTSTSSSSPPSSSSTPPNAGLIEHAEKLFFGQMGLQRAPTPPREAKVPQYMMDLYHWFRLNNHDRQMMLDEEEEEEEEEEGGDHSRRLGSPSSPLSKAVIVGVTGEDIAQLSVLNEVDVDGRDEEEEEEEARLIAAVNGHRRAPSRRRPSQASRVTLSGAASTVVGHKMDNHDHGRINRRTRRSVDSSSSSSPSPAVIDEAHLTFDVQLAAGQQLKGAELRLYRHSIFEGRRGSPLVEPTGLSSTAAAAKDQRQRPNHLYHWSVRYRRWLQPSAPLSNNTSHHPLSPSTNTPTENINNSHSSATIRSSNSSQSSASKGSSSGSHSSGEESSSSSFLQRINVHYLLRPIEELHPVTIRSGGGEQQQQHQHRPVSKLLDTQVVDVREAGWLSFDIAAAVEHWVRRPTENYGLLVTFTDVAGRHQGASWSKLVVVNHEDSTTTHQHSAVQSTTTTTTTGGAERQQQQDGLDEDHPWHEVQPLVITFSGKAEEEDGRRGAKVQPKRVKRNNNNSNSGGGGGGGQASHHHKRKSASKRRRRPEKSHAAREVCSRKPMFFDFQAVGWMDWILAPPGFQAYYCQGRCEYPMAEHLNYTNHATIQALVNSVNFNLVPSPCCVPTELSPVTLLYYDTNNKVVLTNYHDMVVEGCGCR